MRLSRTHSLGTDEARRRVDKLADEIGRQFSVRSEWRGNDLQFSGSGVNGTIAVTDDKVAVDVRLGFALMMMEPAIRSAIEQAMDRHLV